MKTVREQVVDLLIEIEEKHSYAQLSLKNGLLELDARDKALATEVFYGTLKYQIQLDYWINEYSKTPIRKMKPLIRQILRMSVYQMLYLDKIPVSAVINEAVKLTKKRRFQGLSGFVNAVLRKIDRERKQLTFPDINESLSYALSIEYAMPEWIIQMWLEKYKVEEVREIAEALNARAEVCGRINYLKGNKVDTLHKLEEEGVQISPGHFEPSSFYVKKVEQLQTLDSFKEGRWTVQDESAMLVAKVANPKSGEVILDMCSAPGGKSMHMADLMQNKGTIISADIHPHKLELIRKNADRLGVTIVKPTLQDGMVLNKEWIGKFDKVVLDAPCSGLGIMKRKPDIRLNKTVEDLEEIIKVQKALFKNAVQYLKPEGTLVYSTCTISYGENQAIVKESLNRYGLKLNNIVDNIPESMRQYVESQGMIQILPNMEQTDGFFIASMKKGNE